MEFLDIFNAVARQSKGIPAEYIDATSYDDPINEDTLNLDSLDITLAYAMLADIYQISNDLQDKWPTSSVADLKKFIDESKSDDPTDRFETVKDLVREYK